MGSVHRSCRTDPPRADDRGRGLHRLRGTKRATNTGAVRQARCRPQDHGRTEHPPAVARELRWCDAGHLCLVLADAPPDGRLAFKDNRVIGPIIKALQWGEPVYTLLYVVGIIFFAYFY